MIEKSVKWAQFSEWCVWTSSQMEMWGILVSFKSLRNVVNRVRNWKKFQVAYWRLLKKNGRQMQKLKLPESIRTETQIRAPFDWLSCSASGIKPMAKTSSGNCCMRFTLRTNVFERLWNASCSHTNYDLASWLFLDCSKLRKSLSVCFSCDK